MRLGVIGFPVAHSLSPEIHGVFMREAGIEGVYELLPTRPEKLPDVLNDLRGGRIQGLNVTIPYKKAVWVLCDRRTPEADGTGAVNTLGGDVGSVVGHNTDLEAFAHQISGFSEPFLIVGTGGVSAAVTAALRDREHHVFSRNPAVAGVLPVSRAAVFLKGERGTVVNATPLGWTDDDPFPLKPGPGWVFMDLNYNPGWRWRNSLEDGGVTLVTGEGMLVRQAALSFAFWTGLKVPDEVIRKALSRVRRLMGGSDR